MGRRGPRPKPTNLRVLHGDRADRINRSEPTPPAKAPACPAALSPDARRIWRHYAKELSRRGLLTEWDRDTFAVFCEAVAQWRRAKEMCDAALLVGGKRQGLVKNPAWQIMRDAAQIVRAYGQEFGLTPSSRSGISLPEVGDDGELARILS
jgi:P27 family predicted phage terminase small subunit